MKKKRGQFHCGTSGWVYKSWHEMFYPKTLKKDFLKFYSREFDSAEINTTFYHLPRHSTYEKWHDETPDDFRFSVKMSRFITHEKRLKGVKSAIRAFFEGAFHLKKKFAVVLVQLPPSLKYDRKIFEKFVHDVDSVRKRVPIALEPRHKSWFEKDNVGQIKALMKKHKMALVFAHSAKFPKYEPIDSNITAKYVYARFHGPKEFAMSKYGPRRLKPWAKSIKRWLKRGLTVFAYFNDDAHGFAVEDARTLKRLL